MHKKGSYFRRVKSTGLITVILACTLTSQNCRERESGDQAPVQPRGGLTYSELVQSEYRDTVPLDGRYFKPVGEWEAAGHDFEGTLIIPEFIMHGTGVDPDSAGPQDYFPGFAVDFFTYGDYLVPAARETVLAPGERSYWHIILSPGSVWSEPGDRGMSRASFPFTLVSGVFNEAHNGLATFVFDDAEISSLFLQVTQETAPWNKRDYWGITPMTYNAHPLASREDLAARFAEEERRQTVVLPFSAVYETVDSDLVETFNRPVESGELSATGLIWNDTLYLQPCYTRYGEYPYCRYMRHGAFSLTKAMGASIALLRLAEKFGDGVFDLRVADYVEIKAGHSGWDSVSFADALNMATGIGDNVPERVEPNVMQGDEEQPKFFRFMRARSRLEKLEIAFSYGNYPWGPGEVARYNSINTFILSAAMDGFLKSREGPAADIWEMVLEEVYRPVGIMYAPIMRTVEPDGSRGLPLFGYGLYPNVDDVAKLSRLLQNGGRYRGKQILHAGRLAEALFRTGVTGLPTGETTEYGDVTYHLSFNGLPYRGENGRLHRIPVSTGYGGNHWVLLPNGITTFRFSDANRYGVRSMVDVAAAISPLD